MNFPRTNNNVSKTLQENSSSHLELKRKIAFHFLELYEIQRNDTSEQYSFLTQRSVESVARKVADNFSISDNLPPTQIDGMLLSLGMMVAATYMELGRTEFSDFCSSMLSVCGDQVQAYLLSFWAGARHLPNLNKYPSSSYEADELYFQKMIAKTK